MTINLAVGRDLPKLKASDDYYLVILLSAARGIHERQPASIGALSQSVFNAEEACLFPLFQ